MPRAYLILSYYEAKYNITIILNQSLPFVLYNFIYIAYTIDIYQKRDYTKI